MTVQDQVLQAYADDRDDVYHYLLRLRLHPVQAQEATQEVFLRLFLALRRGEEIRNRRAWIFRVAHNLGQDVSKERNHWQPLDAAREAVLPDRAPDPEKHAIERQRAARLEQAVAVLSPQQRQCLHLRAEGLRYREIAEVLGIGVSTVGEFLSRAMARLRRAVDE